MDKEDLFIVLDHDNSWETFVERHESLKRFVGLSFKSPKKHLWIHIQYSGSIQDKIKLIVDNSRKMVKGNIVSSENTNIKIKSVMEMESERMEYEGATK